MKLARRLALAALVLAAAPAFAQDAPAGPGKSDETPPAPTPAAPEAKKEEPKKVERRVDERAMKLFTTYGEKSWTPGTSGAKSASCRAEMPLAMLGGEAVTILPSWKKADGFVCDVELPESITAMVPPEQIGMVKKMLGGQLGQFVQNFIEGPSGAMQEFHLDYKEENGKPIVVATPFSEKADAEKQKFYFGDDGILTRVVITPKIDPNDPQAAMMAGVDIEMTMTHEKRGDRQLLTKSVVTTPMGEVNLVSSFYDGDQPLLRELRIESAMSPEPQVLTVSDWVIDGNPVKGTEKRAEKAPEPKPATPPAPAAPSEPKPAEAPAAPGPQSDK